MTMERKPVYVKIDKYKEAVEVAGLIRKKIGQARSVLGKIHDLRLKEDAEIEAWRADLDEVEKKMNGISQTLTEPEG